MKQPETVNEWTAYIAEWREQWGFKTSWKNLPEKLMLTVAELGEAVDYDRKNLRNRVGDELTDALVRLLDLFGSLGIDAQTKLTHALAKNHRRLKKHGKRY